MFNGLAARFPVRSASVKIDAAHLAADAILVMCGKSDTCYEIIFSDGRL
jgi:hypothetical protein